MDINIMKRIYITETMNVEFRAEFFNVWNNVNWFTANDTASQPTTVGENRNINSVNFARITGTFEPRILQFALKINF